MTPPLFVPALGRSLYPGASVALDFTRNLYRSGTPVVKGSPSLLSGWTFTRASTGYAETAAGALVAFASGAPRITDKGLLVEEARTNLLLRSQEFDNASWTKDATTVTANAVTAPDGTLTADMLVEDGTTANHRCRQAPTVSTATAYVYSVYLKAGTRTWAFLEVISGATDVFCWVNLATGALGNTSGTWAVTSVGNGWYRASVSFTSAAVTATCYSQVSTGNTVTSYAGDGVSGIYIWGAQLEAGAFPTSYIPTTTASATRALDEVQIGSLTLPALVTLFSECDYGVKSVTRTIASWNDGASTNRIETYLSSGGNAAAFAASGGASQLNVSTAQSGSIAKIAIAFDGADYRAAANGTGLTAATAKIAPVGATTLQIGRVGAATQPANQYIRRIIGYPTAFSQAQLNALTT